MPRKTQAGDLNVDLRLDDSQFTRALRRAQGGIRTFAETDGGYRCR